MAVLLIEDVHDLKVDILEEGENKTKNYFLSGIFMQAETINKNQRLYPKPILEREVNSYKNTKIAGGNSYGELDHPQSPTVSLKNASHIITDLHFEGNDVIGKARIIKDHPCGKMAKAIIDEGGILGMSSRALGSLKLVDGVNIVQEDFNFATVDIVADPSAHKAFVNSILEGKEWMMIDGVWTEKHMETSKRLIKEATRSELEGISLGIFSKFLKTINIKI